jgi:hypothetical protein
VNPTNNPADVLQARRRVLEHLGAGASEAEELLKYNENVFDIRSACQLEFPLYDEPFVSAWVGYAAHHRNPIDALRESYPQLTFPVLAGISQAPEYLAATRRGRISGNGPALMLSAPESCQITLYPTSAGRIPLLTTPVRTDFELLVQALSKRNEPVPIPSSMGACMIAGINNWDRVRRYRVEWEHRRGSAASEEEWHDEMRQLIPRRELYQDHFIILSYGPYSGVLASDLSLEEEKWRSASFVIRREHECAHYFTRRVFASMRNNLLDELIADYCGIVKSAGRFRADWFLRFVGLENFPHYRPGARLENYRGTPALSDEAFVVLQQLVYRAAKVLEQFNSEVGTQPDEVTPAILVTLASATLEQLAVDKDASQLVQRLASTRERLKAAQAQTAL